MRVFKEGAYTSFYSYNYYFNFSHAKNTAIAIEASQPSIRVAATFAFLNNLLSICSSVYVYTFFINGTLSV